jgi:hypothetical protein
MPGLAFPLPFQIALGTKVLVLYHCLEAQLNSKPNSGPAAIPPATSDPFCNSAVSPIDADIISLKCELLITAQTIVALPADSLLCPVLQRFAAPADSSSQVHTGKEKSGKGAQPGKDEGKKSDNATTRCVCVCLCVCVCNGGMMRFLHRSMLEIASLPALVPSCTRCAVRRA